MIGTGTITAVASAHGRAPRSIVRLSGPETPAIITELCRTPYARGAHRVQLHLSACTLPALALLYPAPHSYTGEHAAEILLTGSPYIVTDLLDTLTAIEGVRTAGPGEFSARAYLAGKITLDQAEGIASLIAATNKEEASAARRLLSGESGTEARDWIDRIANLLALVEAGIDFTDQEDVVPITVSDLRQALTTLRNEIKQRLGGTARETPPEGPLVVLAGKPNAGKTTLLNALLGRERGVVSPAAGSTRDLLIEPLQVRGSLLRIADAAGFDPSATGPDRTAQQQLQRALEEAAVIVHCDPTATFEPLPIPAGAHTIRVRTKCDLPSATDTLSTDLAVCAIDGYHLSALRESITDAAIGAHDATPRRRRALAAALQTIDEAIGSFATDRPESAVASPELTASALRESLDALGELAGNVTADEVIARVFAGFCVGK